MIIQSSSRERWQDVFDASYDAFTTAGLQCEDAATKAEIAADKEVPPPHD
jgi:predicted secreted protein